MKCPYCNRNVSPGYDGESPECPAQFQHEEKRMEIMKSLIEEDGKEIENIGEDEWKLYEDEADEILRWYGDE